MPEFSLLRTEKSGLPSFLLRDLFNLCFFVLSHPLYFSYFIFFSPYLFKIFSFLSPLFITTTLLLLAFLSTAHVSSDDSAEHKLSYLAATYQALLERLSKADGDSNDEDDEEFPRFEESEVYKIVFETSTFEVRDDPFEVLEEVVKETCLEATGAPVDKCLIHEDNAAVINKENSAKNPIENISVDHDEKELEKPFMVGIQVESLKWCLQEERELENMSLKKEDREDAEVKPWIDKVKESQKVDQDAKKDQEVLFKRSGSKVMTLGNRTFMDVGKLSSGSYDYNFASPDRRFDHQYSWKSSMDDSQGSEFDSSLGSYGSMRREKEWRRTLACKLFEERHNHVDGGEGMDLLWETYETSDQSKNKVQAQSRSNSKKGKKSVTSNVEYNDFDDEYDEEEEAEPGQLCCLQALKFSAGKMNLGMGRPNLVKISKALKGIGWITHVGRHGKKRYH